MSGDTITCICSATSFNSQVTYNIIAGISSTQLLLWELKRSTPMSQCQLSSACVTAAKHLPVLLLKISDGQRQQAAGDKQCLCHHSCFCSEYLLIAFQLYPEKVTEIHTHRAIETHAQQPGGPCIAMFSCTAMYCHSEKMK